MAVGDLESLVGGVTASKTGISIGVGAIGIAAVAIATVEDCFVTGEPIVYTILASDVDPLGSMASRTHYQYKS